MRGLKGDDVRLFCLPSGAQRGHGSAARSHRPHQPRACSAETASR